MEPTQNNKRESMLTIILVTVFGGATFFFLNFVSLGIFSYVIGIVAAIAVVGTFHYVLWGFSLTEETAGEREEAELKARLEMEEKQPASLPEKRRPENAPDWTIMPNVAGLAVAVITFCVIRFVFLPDDPPYSGGGKAVLLAVLLGWGVRSILTSVSKERDE
jgi:amino acid transporter